MTNKKNTASNAGRHFGRQAWQPTNNITQISCSGNISELVTEGMA